MKKTVWEKPKPRTNVKETSSNLLIKTPNMLSCNITNFYTAGEDFEFQEKILSVDLRKSNAAKLNRVPN
jgi:hypothetical protein